ncbi:ATP-dependent DNA ligase [Microbacterium oryzae]|uniref:ATP-dependent DNA ligase n=1 Tax=Microbacterium oryzae TaxID=743009 RepID=UPI0025B1184B|nr:ATP-dependent DNA ligase [Microbacterium oryzae]MDN3310672.1 ATP-dependent DNA ligase [Microbacterium oryzae]
MPAAQQTVEVAGRRLRVSNLERVMYPETGTTKADVIAYYTRIAPLLLPHVVGRPVTRKRWVEGVGTADAPEESFFAKALEPGAPSWVPRRAIPHSTGPKDYPLVEEVASLVYLAQVASLELHVPQWRFTAAGEPGPADRLVLDLDPGPGTGLPQCAEVARLIRPILAGMGLEAHPVTSGSKGVHLYAALPQPMPSDSASALAHELARALEADHPDLVVSAMRKDLRAGRVFVDWSQNNGRKTTVAPYSLRGRSRPWVAAPRTWAELDDPELRHLELEEVLARAESLGDPLAEVDAPPAEHGPLRSYIAKRTAGRTPEPVPETPHADAQTGDLPRFVVHEHHASRLHWDLRLERDGVLASWAVPKGIPETPDRNHLAVRTEDHPLAYFDFHGTIPKGEYGAGTMTIWDTGTYETEKWRDREVIVTLRGREDGPLHEVRIALIRTQGEGEKASWLLHRTKRQPGEPAEQDEVQPSAPPQRPAPMLAVHGTPGLARTLSDPPWAEFKWDGVRALAEWRSGALRLFARSGTEITHRYPELSGPARTHVDGWDALLDGEIVALDEQGRPSFSLLQNRMHLERADDIARERARVPALLYLFDILRLDGRDLTGLPLEERRAILERVTATAGPAVIVPPVLDDVDLALDVAQEHGLEGVVAKRRSSPYRAGTRSEDWLKLKLTRMQEAVIGGFRRGRGARSDSFASLLLGIPEADGLRYVGRVGSGFSERELHRIREVLAPLRADESPFLDVPREDAADATWVSPALVGEVEFAEWTRSGNLRQARWRGLRPDKRPEDVRLEA